MIEHRGVNHILHFIIGVSLLIIPISLYIGLRPLCIVACLGLALFLIDYVLYPFKDVYQTFTHWLPFLFELNIFHGIMIFTKVFYLSKFWTFFILSIWLLRSLLLVYARLLPNNNQHRLYLERKFEILSNFFFQQSINLFRRLMKFFQQSHHQTDDSELEKFQLEPMNSDEPVPMEQDETLNRFQQIVHDLSSPMISNIDCSTSSTPPIRRHHQRTVQQESELEPLSRTPITPAHINPIKGKILHSTMNGSYTGPLTRNRKKTGPIPIATSPVTSKLTTDVTFLVKK